MELSTRCQLPAEGADNRLEVIEEVGQTESHHGGKAVVGEGKGEQVSAHETERRRSSDLTVGAGGGDAAPGPFEHGA